MGGEQTGQTREISWWNLLCLAAMPVTIGVSFGAAAEVTTRPLYLAASILLGLLIGVLSTVVTYRLGVLSFKWIEARESPRIEEALGLAVYVGSALLELGVAVCAAVLSRALVVSFGGG